MKELAIYIHIPFCVKRCRYCDFLSAPCGEEEREEYVRALCREIRCRREELQAYRIRSVFIGGGTPSLLKEEELVSIAECLKDNTGSWMTEAEWTIEANPGTVTLEKAMCWRKNGVNRISLGMQAAQDRLLRSLGRIHTSDQLLKSVETVRQAGFSNMNLDLMMGLPGQSMEDWKETLETAVNLSPEHLSCYSLIVEEGTPLYTDVSEGRCRLPEEEIERGMYDWTLRFLAAQGYRQYEISNFAKEGFECRHNLSYWDLSEYRGIGLGASSYIQGRRIRNEQNLLSYMGAENPALLESVEEEYSEKNAMEEWMFLGLRRTEGIRKADFEARFARSVESVYGGAIQELKERGLLAEGEGRLYLSRKGLDLANLVFEAFLL